MDHIGDVEKRLWSVADNLRANSIFASNEYFMPVMGLIFLRHAYSRFLSAKIEIEAIDRQMTFSNPLMQSSFLFRSQPVETSFNHLV